MSRKKDSRKRFVEEVAKTIIANHGTIEKESFIFGISGKWGEGKTFFLKELEIQLKTEDKSYEVLWINAWKYGQDKTALLRNFLLELKKQVGLSDSSRFDALSYDTSKSKIDWYEFLKWLGLLCVLSVVYYLLTKQWPVLGKQGIVVILGTSIVLPLALAFTKTLTTVKRSSKAISTLDEFDDLLDFLLDHLCGKRNMIVFVDDLDRVSPQVARSVLDNLRTFFDKQKLSYVVTADHTVLERHIGNEILPNSSNETEHQEEGRRFLKKMFNYYWRLPLYIEKEFEKVLIEKLKQREKEVKAIFENSKRKKKDLDIFKENLKKYFGRNPRETFRFVDLVEFTFRIINIQTEAADEENRIYYKSMQENPLLVIRVLMIQELCPPLFEEFLKDNSLFRKLETAVAKGATKDIDKVLNSIELSTTQEVFIKRFLTEKPLFCKTKPPYSLLVPGYIPFLTLAADASFGDARGPEPEEFVALIKEKTSEEVCQELEAMGPDSLSNAAEAIIEMFTNEEIGKPEKVKYMSTLTQALANVENNEECHRVFLAEFINIDLEFLFDSATLEDERNEAIISLWKWLDLPLHDEKNIDEYLGSFDDLNVAQLQTIEQTIDEIGYFSSSIFLRNWLVPAAKSSYASGVPTLARYTERLSKDATTDYIDTEEVTDILIENILDTTNEDLRDQILDLLMQYTESGVEKVKEKAQEKIAELNTDAWEWAVEKEGKETWTGDDLEEGLLNAINNIDEEDPNALENLLDFANGKLLEKREKFWKMLIDTHLSALIEIASRLHNYSSINPPDGEAKKIFNGIIDALDGLDDSEHEYEKAEYIDALAKNNFWKGIGSLNKRKISKIKTLILKTENEEVRTHAKEVLKSWKIRQPKKK